MFRAGGATSAEALRCNREDPDVHAGETGLQPESSEESPRGLSGKVKPDFRVRKSLRIGRGESLAAEAVAVLQQLCWSL